MRIVFMGTPDFAVPCLAGLLEAGHQVCGVFTQPDNSLCKISEQCYTFHI